MPNYTMNQAMVTAATILSVLAKESRPIPGRMIAKQVEIDPTQYDMSTRLWNLSNKGLLKKEKRKGSNINLYSINKEGKAYLQDHKAEVQTIGQYEFIPIKPHKKRKSPAKKKPEPVPKEEEQILSKASTAAFDGISDLININEEMNQALESVANILAEIIENAEEVIAANDLLGMPLIDARKKKWKGIFADIAGIVFDNADTLELIKATYQTIDEILRVKYDYEDHENSEDET